MLYLPRFCGAIQPAIGALKMTVSTVGMANGIPSHKLTCVSGSDEIQENPQMGQAPGQTTDPHFTPSACSGRNL